MTVRPAIVVHFELGLPPSVTVEADHGEAAELTEWLDEHPRWQAFLAEAVELADESF